MKSQDSSVGQTPDTNPFKGRRGVGGCFRLFIGTAFATWLLLAGALTIIQFPPAWMRSYTGLALETTLQIFSFNLLAALIAPILLGVGVVILMILDIDIF